MDQTFGFTWILEDVKLLQTTLNITTQVAVLTL